MKAIVEVIDRYGRRRRLRPGEIPADGETIHIPVMLMDHGGFHPYFADGSVDHTSPFKPGHRFLDVNDEARIAANDAYEQMRERMANAWRNKGQQHDADADDRDVARPRTRTLDALRAAASAAYDARSKRMAGAWKNRHD
jgi:hypothetical protein